MSGQQSHNGKTPPAARASAALLASLSAATRSSGSLSESLSDTLEHLKLGSSPGRSARGGNGGGSNATNRKSLNTDGSNPGAIPAKLTSSSSDRVLNPSHSTGSSQTNPFAISANSTLNPPRWALGSSTTPPRLSESLSAFSALLDAGGSVLAPPLPVPNVPKSRKLADDKNREYLTPTPPLLPQITPGDEDEDCEDEDEGDGVALKSSSSSTVDSSLATSQLGTGSMTTSRPASAPVYDRAELQIPSDGMASGDDSVKVSGHNSAFSGMEMQSLDSPIVDSPMDPAERLAEARRLTAAMPTPPTELRDITASPRSSLGSSTVAPGSSRETIETIDDGDVVPGSTNEEAVSITQGAHPHQPNTRLPPLPTREESALPQSPPNPTLQPVQPSMLARSPPKAAYTPGNYSEAEPPVRAGTGNPMMYPGPSFFTPPITTPPPIYLPSASSSSTMEPRADPITSPNNTPLLATSPSSSAGTTQSPTSPVQPTPIPFDSRLVFDSAKAPIISVPPSSSEGGAPQPTAPPGSLGGASDSGSSSASTTAFMADDPSGLLAIRGSTGGLFSNAGKSLPTSFSSASSFGSSSSPALTSTPNDWLHEAPSQQLSSSFSGASALYPTLPSYYQPSGPEDSTLVFESRFESGNLSRAVQTGPFTYDLVLKPDVNSRGITQWFFFSVTNIPAGTPVTFNILNFVKTDSLYNAGMQPCVYSTAQPHVGWIRGGTKISYSPSSLRRRGSSFYKLTFTYTFDHEHSGDTVYFAHSVPYTYSDLQAYLKKAEAAPDARFRMRRRLLATTIAGNRADLVTITSYPATTEEMASRKGIIITSRVHPGETGASWMMKGVLDFLLGSSPEAALLRDSFVFKLVPMLNPDGVIVGSARCSLVGVDLNRTWSAPSKRLHPTIWAAKSMIRRLLDDREVLLYCDFHGHSRKHNVFSYGCEGPMIVGPRSNAVLQGLLTAVSSNDPREVGPVAQELMSGSGALMHQARAFPRLLDSQVQDYCYEDSHWKVQKAKESTSRVVMWREFGITNSFTLEASFCGPTQGPHANTQFTTHALEQSGHSFAKSLTAYLEPGIPAVVKAYREALEAAEAARTAPPVAAPPAPLGGGAARATGARTGASFSSSASKSQATAGAESDSGSDFEGEDATSGTVASSTPATRTRGFTSSSAATTRRRVAAVPAKVDSGLVKVRDSDTRGSSRNALTRSSSAPNVKRRSTVNSTSSSLRKSVSTPSVNVSSKDSSTSVKGKNAKGSTSGPPTGSGKDGKSTTPSSASTRSTKKSTGKAVKKPSVTVRRVSTSSDLAAVRNAASEAASVAAAAAAAAAVVNARARTSSASVVDEGFGLEAVSYPISRDLPSSTASSAVSARPRRASLGNGGASTKTRRSTSAGSRHKKKNSDSGKGKKASGEKKKASSQSERHHRKSSAKSRVPSGGRDRMSLASAQAAVSATHSSVEVMKTGSVTRERSLGELLSLTRRMVGSAPGHAPLVYSSQLNSLSLPPDLAFSMESTSVPESLRSLAGVAPEPPRRRSSISTLKKRG